VGNRTVTRRDLPSGAKPVQEWVRFGAPRLLAHRPPATLRPTRWVSPPGPSYLVLLRRRASAAAALWAVRTCGGQRARLRRDRLVSAPSRCVLLGLRHGPSAPCARFRPCASDSRPCASPVYLPAVVVGARARFGPRRREPCHALEARRTPIRLTAELPEANSSYGASRIAVVRAGVVVVRTGRPVTVPGQVTMGGRSPSDLAP